MAKKISIKIASAFMAHRSRKIANSESTGTSILLHGNKIAEWRKGDDGNDKLYITAAGWFTQTTKDRLNVIDGVRIQQKNGRWFLNDYQWFGEWVMVEGYSNK